MKVRHLILISLPFMFTGCATPEPIIGPDGSVNQAIYCGSMTYCYKEAREVCQGNYKIVNTVPNTSGDANSTSTSYEMLVKCVH